MLYVNNRWFYGNREVKYTETILHTDCAEVLTQFFNWPDTNEYGVEIEMEDEEHYKISGPIPNMLLFIYQQVLRHQNCTLQDILSNPRELDENMDIYFQKVW